MKYQNARQFKFTSLYQNENSKSKRGGRERVACMPYKLPPGCQRNGSCVLILHIAERTLLYAARIAVAFDFGIHGGPIREKLIQQNDAHYSIYNFIYYIDDIFPALFFVVVVVWRELVCANSGGRVVLIWQQQQYSTSQHHGRF